MIRQPEDCQREVRTRHVRLMLSSPKVQHFNGFILPKAKVAFLLESLSAFQKCPRSFRSFLKVSSISQDVALIWGGALDSRTFFT